MSQRASTLPPVTLPLGLALLAFAEAMLLIDVQARGGALVPQTSLSAMPAPHGTLETLARQVAAATTPMCWLAYLLIFDGILTFRARRRDEPALSPLRARPNRFVTIWLTSVPVWCFFDWINFNGMHAWQYHGMGGHFALRVWGYLIAFAAISPGMFLAAELFTQLGMGRIAVTSDRRREVLAWFAVLGVPIIIAALTIALCARQPGELGSLKGVAGSALLLLGPGLASWFRNRSRLATSVGFGIGFTLWAIAVRDPLGAMTLWVGLIYLLDPLVAKLDEAMTARDGRPATAGQPVRSRLSLIRDWEAGRWGRTLALMAGGAFCGLLWEFWNYWSLVKWTYDLPFMGGWEQVRYFEMPIFGFPGFLPFAAECWVVANLIILTLRRAGLNTAETLPDEAIM